MAAVAWHTRAHRGICVYTAQGDPPENMRRFWRMLLRKSLSPGCLAGLQFAVFGLGDSNYPKYNVGFWLQLIAEQSI